MCVYAMQSFHSGQMSYFFVVLNATWLLGFERARVTQENCDKCW